MLSKYESVCYELLRPEQVKALRDATPIAYVVAGSLEWHGLQNPLGTDSLKAHAICCEAALAGGGVVLPPFYQGMLGYTNWGPKDWFRLTRPWIRPVAWACRPADWRRTPAGWAIIPAASVERLATSK